MYYETDGYLSGSRYPLYSEDHLEKDNPLQERMLSFMFIPPESIERLRNKTGNYNVPHYVWWALISESAEEHGVFEQEGEYVPELGRSYIRFPIHDVKTKAQEQIYCILGPNAYKRPGWVVADIYCASDVAVSEIGKYLFPEDLKKVRAARKQDRLAYSPFAALAALTGLPEEAPETKPSPAPEKKPAAAVPAKPVIAPAPEKKPAPAPEIKNVPVSSPEPVAAETPAPEKKPASVRPPLPLLGKHIYKAYQFYGKLSLEDADGTQALTYAVLTVTEWVRARIGGAAPGELLLPPAKEFRSFAPEKLPSYHSGTGYKLDITPLISEGRWGLRVEEFDGGLPAQSAKEYNQAERPGVPGRLIITHAAFHVLPGEDAVEMAVVTEIEDPDKGEFEPLPYSFRPAFIRTLLKDPAVTVTQGIPVRYKEYLSLNGEEDFERLRELMQDPLCSLPAVIFTHDKGDFTLAEMIRELEKRYGTGGALRDYLTGVDPDASTPLALPFMPYDIKNFADEMYGYARTYRLDSGLGGALGKFLGRDMEPGEVLFWEPACFGGEIRSFRYGAKEEMFRRDDIFKELKDAAYRYTTQSFRRSLKGIPVGDVLLQPKLRDMEWKNRGEQLKKQAVDEEYNVIFEEFDRREKELDRREAELSVRENEFAFAAQTGRNKNAPGCPDLAFLRDPKGYPDSAGSVGRLIRALYPDRFDFTERGLNSLKDCHTKPALLFECFWHMANTLWELYRQTGTDIETLFKNRTAFDHGWSEGQTTTEEQMKLRDDVYNGQTYRFEAHVKKGSRKKADTFIRAYYKYLEGRIVISYCGDHLENASTRKTK